MNLFKVNEIIKKTDLKDYATVVVKFMSQEVTLLATAFK